MEDFFRERKTTDDLKLFLDDLELDVAVNQNLSNAEDTISAWLTHHSWTFDMTGSSLSNQLSSDLLPFLDTKVVDLRCTTKEYMSWLLRQALGIKIALKNFYSSGSLEQVVAHIIAIDILLCNTLLGLYKSRLKDF